MTKLKGLAELTKKLSGMSSRAKALNGRKLVVEEGQLEDVRKQLAAHILHGTPLSTTPEPRPMPTPTSEAPKAFISHNRANKAEAEQLALELRKNGVDAWFDKWEIGPGDSLVEKINDGLAGAQLFVVLLSPEALRSKWVEAELDFGIVARINETMKVVPVIVTKCEVPPLLKATLYVNWSDGLDDVVRKLADVAHGRWQTRKPPVVVARGAPTQSLVPELSAYAFELLKRLIPAALQSTTGWVGTGDLVEGLTIAPTQLEDALEELEEAGCVEVTYTLGSADRLDVGMVKPRHEMLLAARRANLLDFDPMEDIEKVLAKVVSEESATGEDLQQLGLSVERINWAAAGIADQGLAEVTFVMGGEFTFVEISATRATRRWAAAR
jgi:hypothetical protein